MNYCPKCGNKRSASASFCSRCGFNFVEQNSVIQETTTFNTVARSQEVVSNPTIYQIDKRIYASFGRRVVASIIDFGILFVGMMILFALFWDYYTSEFTVQLWGFIIGTVYKVGMESSSHQGTLGKKAMGIKVVDMKAGTVVKMK